MSVALLGGVPVLSDSAARWPSRAGVDPVIQTFDVSPDGLAELLKNIRVGTGVNLSYGDGQVVEGLLIIRQEPGPNPFIKRVVVADRRFLWPYRHVLRRYNMVRRTGLRRKLNGKLNQLVQPGQVPTVAFARYSLKNEAPWKPDEIIRDVLEEIGERSDRVVIEGDAVSLATPVENMTIDDSGSGAVRRALALLPGSNVVVDPDGKVRVFNSLSGAERAVVGFGQIGEKKTAGPEVVGGGHVEMVTENLARPRAVDVLFTVEAEVRFDFLHTGKPNDYADDPARYMDNVLPFPDFTGTIPAGGGEAAFDVEQGTWITFEQFFRYLEAENTPGTISAVTEEIVRKAFVLNLWAALALTGQKDLDSDNANWSARLAAISQHFRQTYRVNRQWWDRIVSAQPYLVSTIDVFSGQRAPSMVWADHAVFPSSKTMFLRGALGQKNVFAWNVDGYPGDGVEITSAHTPAPARVSILDQDQGIIRFDFITDPFNLQDRILPSKIENTSNNKVDPDEREVGIAFNAVGGNGKVPTLAADNKAATKISCVPAAPNSTKQLYRIRVEPGEVRALLPFAARRGLDEARGPVQEVRIGPGVETARIMWREDKANVIKRLFGAGGEPPDADELADLVINDQGGAGGVSAGSLRSIAQAAAAIVYARAHARPHGSMTGDMDLSARVSGALEEIAHQVRTDGAMLTTYSLKSQPAPLELFPFLDSGTRQIILRQVQGPLGK